MKKEFTDELLIKAQKRMLEILEAVHKVCIENNIEYFLIDGTLLGAIRHGGFIPWDDDVDIGMTRENYDKFLEIAQEKLGSQYFVQTIDTDPLYKRFHMPLKVRDNNSKIVEIDEVTNEKYNQGLYIDIFPFDTLPKNKYIYKIQKLISRLLVLADSRTREGLKRETLGNKIAYILYVIVKKLFSFKSRAKILNQLKKLNDPMGTEITYGVDLPCDGNWAAILDKKVIFPVKEIEFCGEKFLGPNNPNEVLEKIYGDYMKLPKEEERVWHAKELYIK